MVGGLGFVKQLSALSLFQEGCNITVVVSLCRALRTEREYRFLFFQRSAVVSILAVPLSREMEVDVSTLSNSNQETCSVRSVYSSVESSWLNGHGLPRPKIVFWKRKRLIDWSRLEGANLQ